MAESVTHRRALILDFDGVIVDTEQVHFESWNNALEELMGFRLNGGYKQLVGLSLEQIFEQCCQAAGIEAGDLSEAVRQRLLDRKTVHFFELGERRLSLMPGLPELVRRARNAGWYVAVASRALRLRLLRTLELFPDAPVFDLVMGSEDIVDPDSDDKVHARAGAVFGAAPEDCLVVEDSASGVASARACGIGQVIGLTTTLSERELLAAGAHGVVERLQDINLETALEPA